MLFSQPALSEGQKHDLQSLQALGQPVVPLRRALEALGSRDGVVADASRLQEARRRVEELAAVRVIDYNKYTDMVRIPQATNGIPSSHVHEKIKADVVVGRVRPYSPRTEKIPLKAIRVFLGIVEWEHERGELPVEEFVNTLFGRLSRKYHGTTHAPADRTAVSNAIAVARSKGWLVSRSRGEYAITAAGRARVVSFRTLLAQEVE